MRADLCGIKKNLTFHIARHTFATSVTLSNGVPIETVLRCWDILPSDYTDFSKIYYPRKQKVMLDMDLAILYQVDTRSLKQAVKRNILRFPDDFMPA